MIASFLLAFREGLEAEIITAIILAYLARAKRNPLERYVWYGVSLVVVASFVFGSALLAVSLRLSVSPNKGECLACFQDFRSIFIGGVPCSTGGFRPVLTAERGRPKGMV